MKDKLSFQFEILNITGNTIEKFSLLHNKKILRYSGGPGVIVSFLNDLLLFSEKHISDVSFFNCKLHNSTFIERDCHILVNDETETIPKTYEIKNESLSVICPYNGLLNPHESGHLPFFSNCWEENLKNKFSGNISNFSIFNMPAYSKIIINIFKKM